MPQSKVLSPLNFSVPPVSLSSSGTEGLLLPDTRDPILLRPLPWRKLKGSLVRVLSFCSILGGPWRERGASWVGEHLWAGGGSGLSICAWWRAARLASALPAASLGM